MEPPVHSVEWVILRLEPPAPSVKRVILRTESPAPSVKRVILRTESPVKLVEWVILRLDKPAHFVDRVILRLDGFRPDCRGRIRLGRPSGDPDGLRGDGLAVEARVEVSPEAAEQSHLDGLAPEACLEDLFREVRRAARGASAASACAGPSSGFSPKLISPALAAYLAAQAGFERIEVPSDSRPGCMW